MKCAAMLIVAVVMMVVRVLVAVVKIVLVFIGDFSTNRVWLSRTLE